MATDEKEVWPRAGEAIEYLEKHRLLELFDNFTAQLIYNRPDRPKEFLIETIEKLMKARLARVDYPCLFDDSNIVSIFGMLDPTDRGFIKLEQYKQALVTMGIQGFDENPAGSEVDKITADTFRREAKQGLLQASSTFHENKVESN